MPKEAALTDAQITEKLQSLPGWKHEAGALRRRYQTDGWPTTLMLVNAIGFYAESADHHPDLGVHWGSVEVALNTHSAGGITHKDFELAKVFEQCALWRPAPGSAFRGTPRKFVSGS